jgi:hypothetical protein
MTFVYIALLLIVLTQYLIERRLRFQSERLDLQDKRHSELERRFRREIESSHLRLYTHEERLDTNTKRLNDAWSHLLRLEGHTEATLSHFAATGELLGDFAILSSRVKSLELAMDQMAMDKMATSFPLRLKKARLARV